MVTMAGFVMEKLRQGQEDIEAYEKASAVLLTDKPVKYKCVYESAAKELTRMACEKSQEVLSMYEDTDGMRREEIAALGASKVGSGSLPSKDVWTLFYDKLRDIKDYHRCFGKTMQAAEVRTPEDIADEVLVLQKGETMFTGEEDWGRKVDLQTIYQTFINWEKCRKYRENEHVRDELARFRRKNPTIDASDPETMKKINEFQEIDYITYLKNFDKFHEFPRWLKYGDSEYMNYLESLTKYLSEFFQRQNPLADHRQVEKQFEEEFEERWKESVIHGWEEPTHKLDFYTIATDRLFASSGVCEAHKKGKKYLKALEALQKDPGASELIVKKSKELDRKIARLESRAQKFREVLLDVIERTIEHLQKKQSRSMRELEEDAEGEDAEEAEYYQQTIEEEEEGDSDEEEKLVYNPLNLPLGWDGKPIPYWLYKLHGLGTEFRCEICGNYSYWGRRAFDRHFQEWRHALGMRCLKIPNTVHFKEITNIEDAIKLYEKLKQQAEAQTFRQDNDIECEDSRGNVMTARAYDDLRKQGML